MSVGLVGHQWRLIDTRSVRLVKEREQGEYDGPSSLRSRASFRIVSPMYGQMSHILQTLGRDRGRVGPTYSNPPSELERIDLVLSVVNGS